MNEFRDGESRVSTKPLQALGISGSLRAASHSTAILHAMSREEFPDITIAVKNA